MINARKAAQCIRLQRNIITYCNVINDVETMFRLKLIETNEYNVI